MIELSYVSLFSGIEAFSIAASRVEGVRWNPVFFSEIDSFPCAVLAHHFPQVPNLGDICKIRVDREKGVITNGTTTVALPGAGIDILAGGPPCQSVSIAGLRHGMQKGSGTRSSLFWEYARLVEELHPRILLYENVPGVLSSRGGRDFYALLCSLVNLGYSVAYRVLDAQYTVVDGFPRAVPQRRKRVWLVGCAGTDESVPAQILLERTSMRGDTPPRREAGKGFACPPGYCVERDDGVVGGAGGRPAVAADATSTGTDAGTDGCNRLEDADRGRWNDAGEGAGTGGSLEVAAPLCAADGKGKNGMDICGKVVVHGVNCLTPGHPQTHRVYTTEGAYPTIAANEGAGQNQQAVLVSNSNGVMPESASFDGADVSATLHKPNGAPGYSNQELFSQGGGYLVNVHELRDVRHGGGSLGVPLGPAGEGHDGGEGDK